MQGAAGAGERGAGERGEGERGKGAWAPLAPLEAWVGVQVNAGADGPGLVAREKKALVRGVKVLRAAGELLVVGTVHPFQRGGDAHSRRHNRRPPASILLLGQTGAWHTLPAAAAAAAVASGGGNEGESGGSSSSPDWELMGPLVSGTPQQQ
jgi:hypothetical protein